MGKGDDMDELISKRAVIEAIEKARANVGHNLERSIGKSIIEILDDVGRDIDRLPSEHGTNLAEVGTKIEPLTDKEQRIFLAAMGRERKVCKEVDDQYAHEPYEVMLTKVCSEIERKVKAALWS